MGRGLKRARFASYNAEGVREFQPEVAATPGPRKRWKTSNTESVGQIANN